MKVLLLGATGLIGQSCLEQLLAAPEITQVVAPTRRPLGGADAKVENARINFDHLDQHPELFQVDAILCCLGTTMKQAGSRDNFRKVDYQYCLDAAKQGRAHGARAWLQVSAMGANPKSPFFYSRVKGDLERDLKSLGYDHLSLYRPSMLLGERNEFRLGEVLFSRVEPLVDLFMRGPLRPYHAIAGKTVARAMVNEVVALSETMPAGPRVNLYTYPEIVGLAQSR